MGIRFIYMTAGSEEEARRIGRELVSERLAACVNIIPGVSSVYRWEGKIQEDRETVLIAKTSSERVALLAQRVKTLHGYDCPCVVSLPVDGGNPDFLAWVAAETAAGTERFECRRCGRQKAAGTAEPAAPECCGRPMEKAEPLPFCTVTDTAEHSRMDSPAGPCDDGRRGEI